MRAMVLEQPRAAEESPLGLRDLPVPTPGEGEVRVAVRCCGVCHTDLHIVEGDLVLPRRPVVPGHQVVGVVDAIGPGVREWREGDRVGVPWLHWACGECPYCRKGAENLCERARFTGLHNNGGYAESLVVPAAFTVALPAGFSDEQAAPLLCAGIVGYRAFKLCGLGKGERVGLYGFGASAHIVLQFARHLGHTVDVFTRTQAHKELARELGASFVGDAQQKPPTPLDAAILFAPAGALVPPALAALRKGGTLALAGIHMSPIPQMDYSLLYHERVLRSVANATRQDAREFLELAAEAEIRADVQAFALEQANEALEAMKRSRLRGAAVLRVAPPTPPP